MKQNDQPREKFAAKLDAFSKGLGRDEVLLFKEVLERGGMTEAELKAARPGKIGDSSMVGRASKLDQAFFHRLMDW